MFTAILQGDYLNMTEQKSGVWCGAYSLPEVEQTRAVWFAMTLDPSQGRNMTTLILSGYSCLLKVAQTDIQRKLVSQG